jgi:hypothetical protein
MKNIINPVALNVRQAKVTIKPNGAEQVDFTGAYFAILTSSSTAHDVIVSLDGTSNASPIKAGIGIATTRLSQDKTTTEPAIFRQIEFRNPSDSEAITIEYLISLSPADDTRTVVQGYLQMDLSAPKIETAAPLLIPINGFVTISSDVLVKERLLTNIGESTIWFGDETVNAMDGRGTPIFRRGYYTLNLHGKVCLQAQESTGKLAVNNIRKM